MVAEPVSNVGCATLAESSHKVRLLQQTLYRGASNGLAVTWWHNQSIAFLSDHFLAATGRGRAPNLATADLARLWQTPTPRF